MTKTEYTAERVSWVAAPAPGGTTFESDLNSQPRPILGFHLVGDCPSCGHTTSGLCPVSAVALSHAPADTFLPAAAASVVMAITPIVPGAALITRPINKLLLLLQTRTTVCVLTCQCAGTHLPAAVNGANAAVAQPADPAAYGCGSSWLVQASYRIVGNDRTKKVQPVPVADEFKYWKAADAHAAAAPSSLSNVQATAGKWQTAITAVLGLVGAATLIGGRDTVQKLGTLAQQWVGGAALVAILTSAAATFFFALASSGIPGLKPWNSPADLVNADLLPLRQAWRSAVDLRVAFALTFSSLAAAIVAVAVVLFSSGTKPPAQVKVAVRDGSATYELCAELSFDAVAHTVTVKPGPNGAASATYPASQLTGVTGC